MLIRPGNDDLLLIIDVQNDFCPGGALAVADGDAVVPVINRVAERFDHIALTQDWHPPGHSSFATSHPGANPFESVAMPYGEQTLWPDHCRQGTAGAAFHPKLEIDRAELIIRKGFRPEIEFLLGVFRKRPAHADWPYGLFARPRFAADILGRVSHRLLRALFRCGRPPARLRHCACRGRMPGHRSGGLARSRVGRDGCGRRAARRRSLARLCYAVRVVRFGIPPAAMMSALKTSIVVRCRIAVCRISENASVSDMP